MSGQRFLSLPTDFLNLGKKRTCPSFRKDRFKTKLFSQESSKLIEIRQDLCYNILCKVVNTVRGTLEQYGCQLQKAMEVTD